MAKNNYARRSKRSRKNEYSTAWLIPLFFIIAILPMWMRGTVIDLTELEESMWIGQDTRFDIFSYWKSIWFILTTIGASLIMAWLHFDKKIKILWPLWLVVPLGIYIFFSLVSWLNAPDLGLAARGFIEIFQGVFVMMAYGVIIFVGFNLIRREKDLNVLVKSLWVLWGLVFFIGFSQFFGFDVFRWEFVQRLILPARLSELVGNLNFTFGPRTIYATMYNTNFVGSYAAIMVPISMVLILYAKEPKPVAIASIFFAFNVFAWYGSNARSGLMGVLVAAVILGALWFFEARKQWKKMVLILGIFVGLFVVMNTASNGTTLSQFVGLTPAGEGSLDTPGGEDAETAYIEEFNIDGYEVEIITDKKSVVLTYGQDSGGLSFTDLDGTPLTVGINESGALTLNEEGYESFSFQFNSGTSALETDFYTTGIDIFLTPEGWQVQGVGGLSADTVNAPRVALLDGLERVASGRGYIWSRTIPMLTESFFVGYGPDMYVLNFPQRDFSGRLNGFTLNGINDKPHNMFLQIAVNVGVVAFLALMSLYLFYFWDSIKVYWKRDFATLTEYLGLGVLTGIFAYLVAGVFNDQIISLAPMFYAMTGVGFALNRMIKADDEKYADANQ